MATENEPQITSTTREKARRLLRDHMPALTIALEGDMMTNERMPDAKFLELFSTEKKKIPAVNAAFTEALTQLAGDGQPNVDALMEGLNLMAGMVKISANADAKTAEATDVKKVAGKFRKRNELGDQPLTGRDKRIIRATAAAAQEHVAPLEQDAQQWKDAAALTLDTLGGVGVDTAGMAQALGLGRGKK